MDSVLRARVREARHRSAVFIDAAATIEQAGHRMQESDSNVLFVRDGERIGVVTGMNLSKAAVLRRLPLDTPVRDICHFDVVSVDAEDFVFEALLPMTRHDKRRVAVKQNGAYVGFLEDIDILGLVAGNTQLIPGRIDRARSVDELAAPAPTSRPRWSGCSARASRSSRSPRSPPTSTGACSPGCSTCSRPPRSARPAASC